MFSSVGLGVPWSATDAPRSLRGYPRREGRCFGWLVQGQRSHGAVPDSGMRRRGGLPGEGRGRGRWNRTGSLIPGTHGARVGWARHPRMILGSGSRPTGPTRVRGPEPSSVLVAISAARDRCYVLGSSARRTYHSNSAPRTRSARVEKTTRSSHGAGREAASQRCAPGPYESSGSRCTRRRGLVGRMRGASPPLA